MISHPAYDPFDQAVLDDPGAAAGVLLEHFPVHHHAGFAPDFWTLSRYEDVRDALLDVRTFSRRYGQGPRCTEERGMRSDAPMHTFFRRLVSRAFTAREVMGMTARIERTVSELLDGFAERGRGDLHAELCFPLPTIVIVEVLGIPAEDRALFKGWSDAWVAALGAEDPLPYAQPIGEMRDYLLEQVRGRQHLEDLGHELPVDLISALVQSEEDGVRLGADDVVNVVRQLLVAGNETTTSLITNVLVRLMEEPHLLERVRADPALVDVAMEESLRFDSPVLGLFRTTTCPVRKHGEEIPEGAKVMLHYGAANRDPAVFSHPDVFNLNRSSGELRSHVAFGLGAHRCLGAELARMEGRIALRQVIDRLPGLTMTAPPERVEPFMLWGKRSLPCRWDVAIDTPLAVARGRRLPGAAR